MDRVAALLAKQKEILSYAQSPLLLLIRLYWGWQFIQTGSGKLEHIDKVAAWFGNDLHIPMPRLNAYMAGGTELVGGIALLLGLRVMTIPLLFTMAVAYATSDREALNALFTDPDQFVTATPFLFLFAALLVLVFGPGAFSLDELVGRYGKGKPAGAGAKNRKR